MKVAMGRLVLMAMLALAASRAGAEEFANAIAAYLQHYVHAQLPHGCMVVGLVEELGARVISCGDLDNGMDRRGFSGERIWKSSKRS
jgi:hypothetical protein